MTYPAGTILFAGDPDEHMQAAKDYIAANGFTKDDVRLVVRGDALLIEAKREVFNGAE